MNLKRPGLLLVALSSSACVPLETGQQRDNELHTNGYPELIACPTIAVGVFDDHCAVVSKGDDNLIIDGTILTEHAVYENGSVLIGVDGEILEVGCDVRSQPSAKGATVLSCKNGIVSPGFINPHDHIQFTHQWPSPKSAERTDHRHQWRLGLDGYTRVEYAPAESNEQIMWGELRHALAGTTSIAGMGGVAGLLRNLENDALNENLDRAPAYTTVFPLGDAGGTRLDQGCDYPELIDAAIYEHASSFQAHLAEGVDKSANNEIACVTGRANGSVDVSRKPASFVHFVGANADDAKFVQENKISVVWSPRSNMSLYGHTANVALYDTLNVNIALSTDWIYSGSMNLLRELQCASSLSINYLDNRFNSYDLWKMVTVNAAKSFSLGDRIGSITAGNFADIAIFAKSADSDPFQQVVNSDPRNVLLVLRSGVPLLGNPKLVSALLPAQSNCEVLPTALSCGNEIAVCASAEFGLNLQTIVDVNKSSYPLMSCSAVPENEPTCEPQRPATYDGRIRPGIDDDGDGIDNNSDNCPRLFNPVRPMDSGQPDWDGDGLGNACDDSPFEHSKNKGKQ